MSVGIVLKRGCSIAVSVLPGMRLARAGLLGLGLVAGGCSNLVELPGSGPAPQIYDLSVANAELPHVTAPAGWRLHIAVPSAPQALDTDRVIIRRGEVELQFYKDARWSERAPRLVQTLLVDAMDATGAAEVVSGDATIARTRYVVKGYLRNFEAQYTNGSRDPHVVIRLKLVISDQVTGNVLKARTFAKEVEASSDNMSAIARAMNDAMGGLAGEAIPWMVDVLDAAHKKIEAAKKGEDLG